MFIRWSVKLLTWPRAIEQTNHNPTTLNNLRQFLPCSKLSLSWQCSQYWSWCFLVIDRWCPDSARSLLYIINMIASSKSTYQFTENNLNDEFSHIIGLDTGHLVDFFDMITARIWIEVLWPRQRSVYICPWCKRWLWLLTLTLGPWPQLHHWLEQKSTPPTRKMEIPEEKTFFVVHPCWEMAHINK